MYGDETKISEEVIPLQFKRGVPCSGLQREMLYALDVCRDEAAMLGWTQLRVTSGRYIDVHGKHSHHYKGMAVDLGSKEFPLEEKVVFINRVTRELGQDYQMLLEYQDTPNEHFHIEYDPRNVEE